MAFPTLIELKECPFCGGEANAFPPTLSKGQLDTDPDKVPGRFFSYVSCSECGATINGPNFDESTNKVRKAWNLRYSPTPRTSILGSLGIPQNDSPC